MAASYTRRINLYINGKAVTNDIATIRAEMARMTNAQNRMIIGSKEYVAEGKKIRALKGIIAQHTAQLNQTASAWSMKNMASKFQQYAGMVTAAVASLMGIILVMRKAIKAFGDFEKALDRLSSFTGKMGDGLYYLRDHALKLSGSMTDTKIRITSSADEIINAFTDMGSMRPELLANEKELAKVTDAALVLSEGALMPLEKAIFAVAAGMNQFGLKAEDADRIINTMAAGSLRGSAFVDSLTDSFKNVGVVAAQSNMTIEDTVAMLEVMAMHQLKGLQAGTQMRSALLSIKASGAGYASGQFNLSDALTEVNHKIDMQTTAVAKDAIILEIFGKRNITAGQMMLKYAADYEKMRKVVTNTNVAYLQAAINTDNHNAKLAQAKNRIHNTAIALGEELAPALTVSTTWGTYFMRALLKLLYFVKNNAKEITTLIGIYLTYITVTKAATLYTKLFGKEKKLQLIWTKALIILEKAYKGVLLASSFTYNLLTGNIGRATAAMRMFNTVTKLNVIGALTAALAGVILLLATYTKRLTAAQQAAKYWADLKKEAEKDSLDERSNLERLYVTAKDKQLPEERRLAALKALIALNPKLLEGLTLESLGTKKAKDQIDAYIKTIKDKYQAQKIKEKLPEVTGDIISIQAPDGKLNKDPRTALQKSWDFTKAVSTSGFTLTPWKFLSKVNDKLANYKTEAQLTKVKALSLTKKKLLKESGQIEENVFDVPTYLQNEAADKEAEAADTAGKAWEIYENPIREAENKRAEKVLNEKFPTPESKKTDAYWEEKRKENWKTNEVLAQAWADWNKQYLLENKDKVEETDLEDLYEMAKAKLREANHMPTRTKEEITKKNKMVGQYENVIKEYDKMGKPLTEHEEKDVTKDKLDKADAEKNSTQSALKKEFLENKISKSQYEAQMLESEQNYLTQKMVIFEKGSKEYEDAQNEFLSNQLKAEQDFKEKMLEAQTALIEAKMDNLDESLESERQREEERWKQELKSLQDQLIIRKNLTAEEIKFNEVINQTKQEKEKAHKKKESEITTAIFQKQIMDKAIYDEATAKTDEEKFAAQREMALANYSQQVADAKGNKAQIAAAEKQLSDETIRIKVEEIEKREELGNAVINAASAVFSSMQELMKEDSAGAKAMFLLQQAVAVGQVIFQTAIANAKAVATFPITAGQPWVTINTVMAAASIASIMAQTIAGFSKGGYTGEGPTQEPAGIVHKKEYVIPATLLQNDPEVAAVTQGIEQRRKGRKTAPITPGVTLLKESVQQRRDSTYSIQPQMNKKANKRGFFSGGYTSYPPVPKQQTLKAIEQKKQGPTPQDLQQNEVLLKLAQSINKLTEYQPSIAIETYERKKKYYNRTIESGL